jgi:hypothetical protein
VDFQFQFMTDFRQLLDGPMAVQELESGADSRLDWKGLDQNAVDRYMHLASRIGVVPWRWTGTHLGLFAAEATGNQVSHQGIAIYLVQDGKIVSCQLTADERREFHDLVELDLNHSPAFTVEA